MLAERQFRLDLPFHRGDAEIVEPRDLALGERLVGELGERGATPQRKCVSERRGGALRPARRQVAAALIDQPLEAVRVQVVRVEPQLVAALARDNLAAVPSAGRKCLPQPRDVNLEGLGRGGRRLLPEELVDQPIGGKRLVRVEQEQRQQSPLLAAPERNRPALIEDLERAKYSEVHASGSGPGKATVEQPIALGKPRLAAIRHSVPPGRGQHVRRDSGDEGTRRFRVCLLASCLQTRTSMFRRRAATCRAGSRGAIVRWRRSSRRRRAMVCAIAAVSGAGSKATAARRPRAR